MIGQQVYQFLSSNSAIAAQVGTRIVPNYVKETLGYPQLVYKLTGNKSTESFDSSGNPYTVELNLLCISERSYTVCDQIASVVIPQLNGFSGQWGSVKILGAFLDDATEDQIGEPNSERVLYYIKQLTFEVIYEV